MSYPHYRNHRLAWVLILVTIIDIIAWMVLIAFVLSILWIAYTIAAILMEAGA